MTRFVGAVNVLVAGLSTLMALSNDIICDAFPTPFIKDKVLSNEFVFELLVLHLAGVLNDSPFELKDVFKTLVLKISRSFLTANLTQNYFLIARMLIFCDICDKSAVFNILQQNVRNFVIGNG